MLRLQTREGTTPWGDASSSEGTPGAASQETGRATLPRQDTSAQALARLSSRLWTGLSLANPRFPHLHHGVVTWVNEFIVQMASREPLNPVFT